MDGMTILRKVEDGKKFHKTKKIKGKGKGKASQKGRGRSNVPSGDERTEESDSSLSSPIVKWAKLKKAVPVRPVAPLPSRSRSSTQDSRPSKRKRQELSDYEDSHHDVVQRPNHPSDREDRRIPSESRTQPPHNSQHHHPAMVPTARYPRQPFDGPSHLTHPSQTTLGNTRTMIPLHHRSHHVNEVSTARAPHHRQLTPVLEEQAYYPAAIQRQHPQSHLTDQYYASTRPGQPPLPHPNGRHPVPRLRSSHLADAGSTRYPSRHYPGGSTVGRDHGGYNYDGAFDPDVGYYGEDYL
jgi:hypothetical protein